DKRFITFITKITLSIILISKYNHNGINELEVVSKNQNEDLKPCSIRLQVTFYQHLFYYAK
ncbi:hypothetical protein, partial [Glaesserella parasuis]|uniref:hypothetical protein n=1 Tax=Glaesserella parasuis TaxID=738 RepID=UPI001BE08AB3